MRTVSTEGELGPAMVVRDLRGTTRGLSVAARADDVMVAWNAEYGGYSSSVSAQRMRRDGTQVGAPVVLGVFRAGYPSGDAAVLSDPLGFAIRVSAAQDRYLFALRGPLVPCGQLECPSVRVAEIDESNFPRGRGSLDHPHPAAPLGFTVSPEGGFGLALTVDDLPGGPTLRVLGDGPLGRLPAVQGAWLLAAWTSRGAPRALLRRNAQPGRPEELEVLGVAPLDAGAGGVRRVERVAVSCAGGVPAVQLLAGRSALLTVPVTDPGAEDLLVWALNHEPRPAAGAPALDGGSSPTRTAFAAAWTGAGLVIAREGGLEFARCQADALAPGTALSSAPSAGAPATTNAPGATTPTAAPAPAPNAPPTRGPSPSR